MGRLLLLLLIVAALVLVWRAFGPRSWKRNQQPRTPEIKGPDDDENFLWEIEKNRFKERRAREEAQRQEQERQRRLNKPGDTDPETSPER
ncbi:hypothetical protein EML15_09135 [Corynebacterium sp. sy017]|uniref:hypothetical protein n=1 Tax=unclassified Corynebacterium TaxID=2624378 RepID=UPI0011855059|nr:MULTISPECIES: hypothetical protein [unclassified Corynebacterium]MBP3089302.1 hypothetical protein [Corynebacterium sp. sy017]TSD90997.1 hypothetical protein ELY17_09465 [Corynebacterium sp. SY003]